MNQVNDFEGNECYKTHIVKRFLLSIEPDMRQTMEKFQSSNPGARGKIRWSLRRRLCEQLRQLSNDLFDEVDDMLFTGGQRGQFGDDGSYLKAMREIRTKRERFDETFLNSVDKNLSAALIGKPESDKVLVTSKPEDITKTVYEKVETDLALQAMQRKAFKYYAPWIRQLESILGNLSGQDSLKPVKKEFLVKNTVYAFEVSHEVFKLPLEIRLIFFKLFEQHLLLKMDKMFQDTMSILNNLNDEQFVARLISSSTGFGNRLTKAGDSKERQKPQIGLVKSTSPLAKSVDGTVKDLLQEICASAKLPSFIETMLNTHWHDVLLLIGLNSGVGKPEWNQARLTAGKLAELIAIPQQEELTLELADLCSELQKGFSLVQLPLNEQQGFIKELQDYVKFKTVLTSATSLQNMNLVADATEITQSGEFSIGDAGRKILNNEDLDEIIALLSADKETVVDSAASAGDPKSMVHFLEMVDRLAGATDALYVHDKQRQNCVIQQSDALENSYHISSKQGRILLTRSRLGLAISLREGEFLIKHTDSDIADCKQTVVIRK